MFISCLQFTGHHVFFYNKHVIDGPASVQWKSKLSQLLYEPVLWVSSSRNLNWLQSWTVSNLLQRTTTKCNAQLVQFTGNLIGPVGNDSCTDCRQDRDILCIGHFFARYLFMKSEKKRPMSFKILTLEGLCTKFDSNISHGKGQVVYSHKDMKLLVLAFQWEKLFTFT